MAPVAVGVVEDFAVAAAGTRLILETKGMRVAAVAGTAAEALRLFSMRQPDVLCLDLRLPDGNGVALYRRLRSMGVAVPALLMTGFDPLPFLDEAMAAGLQAVYAKGDPAGELILGLEAALAGRPFASRSLAPLVQKMGHFVAASGQSRRSQRLTLTEVRVLLGLSDGLSPTEIAGRSGCSEKTVRAHLRNIYLKLGVSSQAQALMAALRLGYIRTGGG